MKCSNKCHGVLRRLWVKCPRKINIRTQIRQNSFLRQKSNVVLWTKMRFISQNCGNMLFQWKNVIPFFFCSIQFQKCWKCLEPRAVIQSNHPHAAVHSVADSYSQKTNRTSSSCAVWETILKFTLRFNINFISVFCMENNTAICWMDETNRNKKNRSTITKTTLSKETLRPKQWKINLPSTPKLSQRNATPEIQFPDQIKPDVITLTWINKKQETNKIHVL